MRVFALSDIHIDFKSNAEWVGSLSSSEYRDDVLILAGDVTDCIKQMTWCFELLAKKFFKVLFVPGNHDLWVMKDGSAITSLEKFNKVRTTALQCDVSMVPFQCGDLSIVPLLGWYDYSFGMPTDEIQRIWMDYKACRWPERWSAADITNYFLGQNDLIFPATRTVISFSHFLPRIDLMPSYIPLDKRILYPVLGSSLIDEQIKKIKSDIHVYGHSHVNNKVVKEGTLYINNAFGYPYEKHIAYQGLKCIYS